MSDSPTLWQEYNTLLRLRIKLYNTNDVKWSNAIHALDQLLDCVWQELCERSGGPHRIDE